MLTLKKVMTKILMPLTAMLTPACQVIAQKISRSLDERISLWDRLRIWVHLLGCDLCTRYQKQLLLMRKVIEDHADDMIETVSDSELSEEARKRIKNKINQNRSK